jgi:hypothetical protein
MEKRVKTSLVAKLESLEGQILPFLNSREGNAALEKTYIGIIKREQQARPAAQLTPVVAIPAAPLPSNALPAYASVSFYLNQPKTFV